MDAAGRVDERTGIRGAAPAGALVLAVMSAVWSWWAWQQGAWFGVVVLPGTVVLCGVLLVLSRAAPLPALRWRSAGTVTLCALLALGGWAALSGLWTPSPNVAVADAQRILLYAIAFGLGLWMSALLGRRAGLSLAPLAVAGAVAGLIAAVGMITTGDPASFLEEDGTLQHPIGYRNANAAFFLIAFFPALGLAMDRELDWRLRGLALAAATLCVGAALLSQSRGSVPAALIALVAYVAFSPLRLRALCWLALALAPAVIVVPALTRLFESANDLGIRAVGDELAAAGTMLLVASAASLVIGLAAARFERATPGIGTASPRGNAVIGWGLVVAVVGAVAAFVVAVGDPVDWTVKRAEEFRGGSPSFEQGSTRFQLNFGTDRYDLWRVAIDDARADPLAGTGAGGFQYTYLRERESRSQTARDAHSVELEVLGELGVPGLALLTIALVAAAVGMVRARRAGPRAAALSAIALAAGTYWLAHASIDWLWAYPAITAPTFALAGAACAAGLGARSLAGDGRGWRLAIAAATVALALTAIPPFLSERYVNDAYAGWRDDLGRTYDDLARARSLNPLTDSPLLAEGAIADAAGDPDRALAAYREAIEMRPEEWGGHFLIAELLARENPGVARRELAMARRLNPNSPEIEELSERLAERARE